MRLRFIGTGAAFYPVLGSNSACFARGDDLYLLDCGESVFGRLYKSGMLQQTRGRITVILTHLHADHCGSLATLALYASAVLGRPLTIVHPNEEARTLLRLMGVTDTACTLVPSLCAQGLEITPIPVRHAPTVTAFAYLLRDEAETIYYSGDSVDIPPEVLDGLRGGGIQRLYQDVSHYAGGNPPQRAPHLYLDELEALISSALRPRVTVMHYNEDFAATARARGFDCAAIDPLFA